MRGLKKQKIVKLVSVLTVVFLGLVVSLQVFSLNETGVDRLSWLPGNEPVLPDVADQIPEATHCRYGVGYVPDAPLSVAWIPTLRAGWFLNFSIFEYPEPSSEFVFTIRLRQVLAPGGVRLPQYTIYPPLVDYYYEGESIKPGLGHFLMQSPGATWLVGNEIDIDNSWQDNIMPDLYAQAYYDTYHYIKSVDPTAQVGIGSVLQATPGRLQYLDIVWDTYQTRFGKPMPVDVWNIHLYILAERTKRETPQYADGKIALGTDPNLAKFSTADPNDCPQPGLPDTPENDPRADVYCESERMSVRIFEEQVTALRTWMKEKGQQNKPLIISEYGSLNAYIVREDGTCGSADEFGNCFDPVRVSQYLRDSTEYMENAKDPSIGYPADENRLVQRWLWYSIYTPHAIGKSSNLLVYKYDKHYPLGSVDALSLVGQTFRSQAEKFATRNLAAEEAGSSYVFVNHPDDRGTATLTATFRNAGTYSIVNPFSVTFYADAELTKPIGTAVVDPAQSGAIMGCSWIDNPQEVSLDWPDLAVGNYSYWVKVDSPGVIAETDENDNVTTRGEVTVRSLYEYSYQNYIPFTR
jgi:hypothetical protein